MFVSQATEPMPSFSGQTATNGEALTGVAAIHAKAESLGELAGRMEARLAAVMRREPPEGASKYAEARQVMQTELGERLQEAEERLGDAYGRLSALLARIDI